MKRETNAFQQQLFINWKTEIFCVFSCFDDIQSSKDELKRPLGYWLEILGVSREETTELAATIPHEDITVRRACSRLSCSGADSV